MVDGRLFDELHVASGDVVESADDLFLLFCVRSLYGFFLMVKRGERP